MATGADFINILCVQLLRTLVLKAQKNTTDLTVFFAHLGSTCIKAASKVLMKLTLESISRERKTESRWKQPHTQNDMREMEDIKWRNS